MGGVFTRPLLLDFRGTTAWDFSTVSYIIQQMRNRMGAGGAGGAGAPMGRPAPVGIINAPPELRAEFEMAKLDELLRVYGTEEEALEAMGER